MSDDLIHGLRADFAFVAQGDAPAEMEERLRIRLTDGANDYDGTLLPHIFTAYMVGRDHDDSFITDVTRYVLGMLHPEAAPRLPWYEAMFDIIDDGTLRQRLQIRQPGSISFYDLSGTREREIAGELEANVRGLRGADRLVRKLCYWLADIPGTRLQPTLEAYSETRVGRTTAIASHLHQSLAVVLRDSRITTIESAADFHYRALHEEAH